MMAARPEREAHDDRRRGARSVRRTWFMALLPALLPACVQVTAPERPIEINLNINIRQEVVVSLQGDVRDLIEENPGVF